MKKVNTELVYDIDSIAEMYSIKVLKNGENIFSFELSMANSSMCCGLDELHAFNFYGNDSTDKMPAQKIMIEAITRLLKQVIEDRTNDIGVITLFFTTIEGQEIIDKAIRKNKFFTLVKSFINMNTGNLNKFYISNEGSI